MPSYIVKNWSVPVSRFPAGGDGALLNLLARELHRNPAQLEEYRILNKSIDSRKGEPRFIYTLLVDSPAKLPLPEAAPEELAALAPAQLSLPESSLRSPIVVGTGPAGIFGALALAMAGVKPVILDRGFPVDVRKAGWKKFCETRKLDEENNLLIGEGGAGAFSDGKLYTGTKDVNRRFIVESMIRAGAPPEIAYLSRPHVGSDRLPEISRNLRKKIEELGGEFHFGVSVSDILVKNGRCAGVIDSQGEHHEAPSVLIAPGLGGRHLVRRLAQQLSCSLKPFQTGCRIIHPQELIDSRQYHCPRRPGALGAAEYHMVSRPQAAAGVSTFCMCPGGTVVNATAWENHSISNGMSNYARSGKFANSCLITTLMPETFGTLENVSTFFDELETGLFLRGGHDYALPAQDAADFLAERNGQCRNSGDVEPGFVSGRIDDLLAPAVRKALQESLRFFDRQCPGFVRSGLVTGIESCVSSPLRFERKEDGCSSLPGLYLSGEGVGAAGGILSGAADGIRMALAMLKAFQRANC